MKSIEEIFKDEVEVIQRDSYYKDDMGRVFYDLFIAGEWIGTVIVTEKDYVWYYPCRRKEVML